MFSHRTVCRWLLVLLLPVLSACSEPDTSFRASGNSGSTTGKHHAAEMTIVDTNGSHKNFAYGVTAGYPGAAATIGRMAVPVSIKGMWEKYEGGVSFDEQGNSYKEPVKSLGYYRLSASFPEDTAAKMQTMNNYYSDYEMHSGVVRVVMDGPRLRVFYTITCYRESYRPCTPREGGDPNGWVQPSLNGMTESVLLFDGIGESSETPWPGSIYEEFEERREKESNA